MSKVLQIAGVTTVCVFFGCWGAFAPAASAQAQSGSSMHKADKMSKSAMDEQFAKKAAQGGMAEVKLGQLAQEKGSNEAVKNFGKRMVEDHSKANEELKSAAGQENIALPNDLDAKDQETYDTLSKLSGTEFDKAYAHHMVKDHEKDVSEFKKEASHGQKDQIKSFASQTLPTLEDHLKEAKQMMQKVSGESAKESSYK